MATGKTYYPRPSHRFLPTDRTYHGGSDTGFEFNESDLYSDSSDFHGKLFTSGRIETEKSDPKTTTVASSLPMNVPNWSKTLGVENRRRRSIDEDGGGSVVQLPPHEYLAKTRNASFSVHEGFGRTLKGRDLSRVRNAILEKTGFLD